MIRLVQVDPFSEQHARWLYDLMRERSTEDDKHVNISHRALPSWQQHAAFVQAHPYRAWFLIMVDELFVGSLSATARNEIGIVLLKDARGHGIGPKAVKHLMETLKPLPASPSDRAGQWLANINPRNKRSLRMFNDLGFRPLQVTYAHD